MSSNFTLDKELTKELFDLLNYPVLLVSGSAKIIYANPVCQQLESFETLTSEITNSIADSEKRQTFTKVLVVKRNRYKLNFNRVLDESYYFVQIKKSKIEKQNLESEERFRRMFEQSSFGIYQTTLEGKLLNINEAFAKLFGYSTIDELLVEGESFPRQFYAEPLDREKILSDLEKEPGQKAVHEVRFKKRNGTIFFGSLNIRKVCDADGNLPFYEGYIEDITDRKTAELALQYSKNKYKHLVETIPYGIVEVDLEGYVTYCNTPFEIMLKYNPGELKGKQIYSLKPERLSKQLFIEFSHAASNEITKPERGFDRIKTKSGNILEVQIDWNYLYNENKNIIGFMAVLSDISGQIQAANALKESENRFRGIYENSTIGIYRSTIDGEILMANPAMCSFFGYSSYKDFKKINISDIYLYPEERQEFLEQLKKFGFINGFETRGKKKDGSMLYLRISAHVVENKDDTILFYDGILEDYTEKKLMECKLLKAKEEAENADRLKSAFLANMSHEVRTPMNGIMGFANLLRKPDLTDAVRLKYINIIRNRGEDLLRIINDILDVSKLEVSQLKLYKKEFLINNFMSQLYEVYKQKLFDLGKTALKIELDLEHENFVLYEDETRINQILTNFIDNAIKFTESGSIEIGYEIQYNSIIRFYVKDSGIGVPENMQKVIFERFRQYDEAPSRIYGGNGLGLAICKGLAELMNGSVGVVSKEKQGSTFYFNLPSKIKYKISEKEPDTKNLNYNWRGKKILVVEDDDISSALIEEYFETTKATVKIAMDGYSALRILKDDKNFNLVLLDIGLPDISGLVIAKQIKKFYPNIPVIAQTAFAMQDDEFKCKVAGCDDYMQKPIVKKIMLEKVGEYLNIN